MKDFGYLIENFFTHKDYLVPGNLIPGTLFTPLHFLFASVLLAIVIAGAVYLTRHKHLIKPVFITIWAILAVWEVVIIAWESTTGKVVKWDLATNLSLYPCSIYLYAMPFAIWGKGLVKKIACGYVCTLGLLGGAVNFFYPAMRLSTYSCISFIGFHTFFFHASLLFTCLVMLTSGYHRYTKVTHWWELLLPCIPTLILSIPANIVNYSPINADYMFFRGHFPLVASIAGNASELGITLVLYVLYIIVPALFYLPSYVRSKRTSRKALAV